MFARAASPLSATLGLAAVLGLALTLAPSFAQTPAQTPAQIPAQTQRFPGHGVRADPLLTPPAGAADVPAAPWRVIGLPEQSKPFTRFSIVTQDGQRVLRVEAVASYGNLVHPLGDSAAGARQLSWRWRVDELVAGADLRRKEADDSPIKVCALFDLPMAALPFADRQLLRVARIGAGEILPSASVCYVWDNQLAPGTVLDNAFTRRVRTLVLRGPETPLRGWVSEQRDVAADFLRLFGDEAKTVPPLMGVAVGADADNTKGHSLAFVGPIMLD
jgi:hypothetical protein